MAQPLSKAAPVSKSDTLNLSCRSRILGMMGRAACTFPAPSMQLTDRLITWLETRYAAPAYPGWVLMGLTLCFWLAAANTMAGWLYVVSGVSVALLLLSAVLARQTLKQIKIQRSPVVPVHVGDTLFLALTLHNTGRQPKGLLVIQDRIPPALGQPVQAVIETILPQQAYPWRYSLEARQRGRYQWKTVVLRTAAPFGLLWSRRVQKAAAEVLIYPQVLPLSYCPVLDEVSAAAQRQQQIPLARAGQEGATRSLRPYRWGDPMRLVHWKSSARFNEMRVRELEHLSGGNTVLIALDTHCIWLPSQFEQAVVAAASLFSYALKHSGTPQLWTPGDGLIQTRSQALAVLAQITPHPSTALNASPPLQPSLWLTANPASAEQLPPGSRTLLWGHSQLPHPGLCLSDERPLLAQLQQPLIAR